MMLFSWPAAMMDEVMMKKLVFFTGNLVLEIVIFRACMRLEPLESFMFFFGALEVQLLFLELVKKIREEVCLLAHKKVPVFPDGMKEILQRYAMSNAKAVSKLCCRVAIASCGHWFSDGMRPMDCLGIHVMHVASVESLNKIDMPRDERRDVNLVNAHDARRVGVRNAHEAVVLFCPYHQFFAGDVKKERIILLVRHDFFGIKRLQVPKSVKIINSMNAPMILRFYTGNDQLCPAMLKGLLDAGYAIVIRYCHADVFLPAFGKNNPDLGNGVHAVRRVKVHVHGAKLCLFQDRKHWPIKHLGAPEEDLRHWIISFTGEEGINQVFNICALSFMFWSPCPLRRPKQRRKA